MTAARPPRLHNDSGEVRRIGVEIEFAGLDCGRAAALVQETFGGTIVRDEAHRCRVRETPFGDFTVELDMRFAHPEGWKLDKLLAAGEISEEVAKSLVAELSETVGEFGSLWMPCEVASPPVPIDRVSELDPLIRALRGAKAEGTRDGVFYAFGLHLNPELSSLAPEAVLRHLQAYLLLAEWLRAEIKVDLKRRILPFIDPFPRRYVLKVLDAGYAPEIPQLIDDYLADNPTRNRELDMLPLFAHLDRERVLARVHDAHVKPRPTFHYRLPDSRLDLPDWGVTVEWNRWVEVERLAEDPERLRGMADAYIHHFGRIFPGDWSEVARTWVGR